MVHALSYILSLRPAGTWAVVVYALAMLLMIGGRVAMRSIFER